MSGYRTTGFTLLEVPDALLPYATAEAPDRVDAGVHDEHGVRMFEVDGALRNHPVGQAQYGLTNLAGFRLTGDRFYLDRAISQAQRLVDTQWREAAQATFSSLSLEPDPAQPWGTWVDDARNLWLEEYPRWPAMDSERVLNGHMFAAFGVFDYHRLTGDPRAKELYDGAVTTVLDTFESGFRRPGWVSEYSLFHARPHLNYHQKHTTQLLALYRQTGHPALAAGHWLPVTADVELDVGAP